MGNTKRKCQSFLEWMDYIKSEFNNDEKTIDLSNLMNQNNYGKRK